MKAMYPRPVLQNERRRFARRAALARPTKPEPTCASSRSVRRFDRPLAPGAHCRQASLAGSRRRSAGLALPMVPGDFQAFVVTRTAGIHFTITGWFEVLLTLDWGGAANLLGTRFSPTGFSSG